MEALQSGPEEEEDRKRGAEAVPSARRGGLRMAGAAPSPERRFAELSDALFKKNLLSEALVRDHASLVQALLEEQPAPYRGGPQARCSSSTGERVTASRVPGALRCPRGSAHLADGAGTSMTAAQLVAEVVGQ